MNSNENWHCWDNGERNLRILVNPTDCLENAVTAPPTREELNVYSRPGPTGRVCGWGKEDPLFRLRYVLGPALDEHQFPIVQS